MSWDGRVRCCAWTMQLDCLLKICFKDGLYSTTAVQSFLRGAAELRFLEHPEIDLLEFHISTEIANAIASFVVRQGALAHFDLEAEFGIGCKSWQGLGLALRSVKRVSHFVFCANNLFFWCYPIYKLANPWHSRAAARIMGFLSKNRRSRFLLAQPQERCS